MSTIDPMDYLLGELEPAAVAEAERLMRTDTDFRAEVERLRPAVAALEALPDEAWEPPVPPPLVLPPDLEQAPTAARPARSRGSRPWWRLSVPVPALGLAAAVALVVGVGIGVLASDDGDAPVAPATVTDVPLASLDVGPASATGDARVLADGELAVDVSGLTPSAGRDFYTVWLLGKDGRLVPLGSFRVPSSGSAALRVPLPVDPAGFDYVDVSVEPDDGDPGHSGDSVLRGPTV